MRAVCGAHEVCTLSRTCRASDVASKAAQGRPIGYLWALLNASNQCGSREEHRAFVPSFDLRWAARTEFALMPGSEDWFGAERVCRPGEADEPDGVP